MKLLFDLFPILLFFAVFKIGEMDQQASYELVNALVGGFVADGGLRPDQGPIMLATLVAIVGSVCQLAYVKLRGQTIDILLWMSFIVIVIFGSLTIYLHNDTFIKWKPTIIFWLQAGAFGVALAFFKKNLVRQAMGSQFELPDEVWTRLCLAWIAAFVVIGAVNLLAAFVIFKGDTSAWVSFKLFGMNGMLFAFIIGQAVYLSKYMQDEPEKKEEAA